MVFGEYFRYTQSISKILSNPFPIITRSYMMSDASTYVFKDTSLNRDGGGTIIEHDRDDGIFFPSPNKDTEGSPSTDIGAVRYEFNRQSDLHQGGDWMVLQNLYDGSTEKGPWIGLAGQDTVATSGIVKGSIYLCARTDPTSTNQDDKKSTQLLLTPTRIDAKGDFHVTNGDIYLRDGYRFFRYSGSKASDGVFIISPIDAVYPALIFRQESSIELRTGNSTDTGKTFKVDKTNVSFNNESLVRSISGHAKANTSGNVELDSITWSYSASKNTSPDDSSKYTQVTLPSGGTWMWNFLFRTNNGSVTWHGAGKSAGGTTFGPKRDGVDTKYDLSQVQGIAIRVK